MTISRRLQLFVLIALLTLFCAVGGNFLQINQVRGNVSYIGDHIVPSIRTLATVAVEIGEYRRELTNFGQAKSAQDQATVLARLEPHAQSLSEELVSYQSLTKGSDDAMLLERESGLWKEFRASSLEYINLVRSGQDDSPQMPIVRAKLGKTGAALLTALKDHVAFNDHAQSEAQRTAYETIHLMSLTSSALLIVGAIILIGFGRSLYRRTIEPLRQIMVVSDAVAQGDLSRSIVVQGKDEIAQILTSISSMQGNLVQVVTRVRQGSEKVAVLSGEIIQGNYDLSARTESQASSLEETAASMEELTSTVKQNADNARQANQLAVSASEVALKGGTVVSEVVATMGSINASSRKIVDIIAVIDGIAFQTNILALNAAVEAARAGEQGRGFAVVATEVRNLAQRSAAAAKEIKELIGDSVDKVDVGARLVDQAGVTMEEIVMSIKRVTDIMGDITAASQEQSSGIEQVNQAIIQMDQVTQKNTTLVEEAAAAARSLQDQAGELVQVVSVFQTAAK